MLSYTIRCTLHYKLNILYTIQQTINYTKAEKSASLFSQLEIAPNKKTKQK